MLVLQAINKEHWSQKVPWLLSYTFVTHAALTCNAVDTLQLNLASYFSMIFVDLVGLLCLSSVSDDRVVFCREATTFFSSEQVWLIYDGMMALVVEYVPLKFSVSSCWLLDHKYYMFQKDCRDVRGMQRCGLCSSSYGQSTRKTPSVPLISRLEKIKSDAARDRVCAALKFCANRWACYSLIQGPFYVVRPST